MTKTEQLNSLFIEWKKRISSYNGFFHEDGIINEPLFQNAPYKILFIAKEPNNPEKEGFDYREWWKEEIRYTFSYRIAEWSFGILNDFPEYDEIWEHEELPQKALQQIAFMNIKKSGGGGNSTLEIMMNFVTDINLAFLINEIEIIEPEIIILGISWLELRDRLFPKIEFIRSGYGIEIGKFNNAKIIDFYHPSSRTAPAAAYCLLQNVIRSERFKGL